MRTESLATWTVGAVFGALAGVMVLFGGAPLLLLALAFLALAFVAARSLAFLSGTFVGVGGSWLVMALRAELACVAFDSAPNQGCQGFGVGEFLGISAAVIAAGVVIGALARRRRGRAT